MDDASERVYQLNNVYGTLSASQKASSLVAADAERKRLAQKAFVAYVRSVLLMRDKSIFDVEQLPFEEVR